MAYENADRRARELAQLRPHSEWEAADPLTLAKEQAENGDLRVYHIQNPPASPIWHDVETPRAGFDLMNELARRDMRPEAHVESNVIGLNVYEDGDWVDWYDDEGDDIDQHAERQGWQ